MNDNPNAVLLALDTSTNSARVALVDRDERVLAHADKTATRHSSNLLQLVDEVLGAARVQLRDLAGIACGAGPGSFTGLRVGMSVAKGLALPLDLPFLSISSLHALATDLHLAHPAAPILVPCLDAGKEQVYAQVFQPSTVVDGGGVQALSPLWAVDAVGLQVNVDHLVAGGLPQIVYAGNGADRYATAFADAYHPGHPAPTAQAIARLAWPRLLGGRLNGLDETVPLYGRQPDITKPKPKAPRTY